MKQLLLVFCVLTVGAGWELAVHAQDQVEIFWRYTAPSGACEIAAFSAATGRLFVTVGGGIDVVSTRDGTRVAEMAIPDGFHATSAACTGDVVAVAWAADDKRERGRITFYNAEKLTEIANYSAGFLPDMIVFTPDGKRLLAANEGEPTDDYAFDPEASISVMTAKHGWKEATVREAAFTKFNPQREELMAAGVHLFGPHDATVAQDVEPEYIAVGGDSRVAWITLQENNAIAELDLEAAEITAIHPLGLKSFRSLGNPGEAKLVSLATSTGLDVSDQDGGARIRHWPIWGMYQPDGIATFQQEGENYLVTANEGDPRDYIDFHEALPVGQLAAAKIALDHCNPGRRLTGDEQLGRLEVSRAAGDSDGDGDLDKLVCFGTRSFSIWRCTSLSHNSEDPSPSPSPEYRGGGSLEQVFDSGNDFEQTIAAVAPELFNVDSKGNSATDVRSTERGPEPENVAVFEVGRRRLAAIGLERTGGAMLYDISTPAEPLFLKYLPPQNSGGKRDLAPEGLVLIPAEQNASGKPLLVLCNEGSGTMTAYEIGLE
ncbi:MAG: choice-of-anchor I family protein [Bythopirellula sp.]|nr:choice-of-anchor I family protein [Bythopirellula sp.]